MTDEHYPFQSSEGERRRLIAQAGLVAPLTERLFEKAGITPGMRVLDIGSGSGDVALLAARLVGSEGTVVGVDRDPAQVAFATQRAKSIQLLRSEAGNGMVGQVCGKDRTHGQAHGGKRPRDCWKALGEKELASREATPP